MSGYSKATWVGLAEHLDNKQLLELLFVIGSYFMLAWIFNSTGLEMEERFGPIARSQGYPMLDEAA